MVGWSGWARSHFFRVCWKRSTLPQVVGRGWSGVLLDDVESSELGFEGVLAAAAAVAGQADGVDHAVVGERGCGVSVQVSGLSEGGQHDRCGDPGVCGDVEGVAGVVVEPGDDLGVGAGAAVGSGESVVGEVGLPGLVRHRGLEAQVGGLRSLARIRCDGAGAAQDPVDGGSRHRHVVAMLEVPADGLRAGVQAARRSGPCAAAGPGPRPRVGWRRVRSWVAVIVVRTRPRPRLRYLASSSIDPGPRDPVVGDDLGDGAVLEGDGGDDQTGLRGPAWS